MMQQSVEAAQRRRNLTRKQNRKNRASTLYRDLYMKIIARNTDNINQ